MSSGHGKVVVIGAAEKAEAVGQHFKRALRRTSGRWLRSVRRMQINEVLLLEAVVLFPRNARFARCFLKRDGHVPCNSVMYVLPFLIAS